MKRTKKRHGQVRRLSVEYLEPRLVLDASMLRISELVASNDSGLADADGQHSDWLEIFNSGSDAVDLSGMYLADSKDRWQFPNDVTLPAGGYRVVFASNKNTVLAGGELHTSFALSAGGESLSLLDKDGVTIIDQYSPKFPEQFEDISYGRSMQAAGAPTTILTSGAAAKAVVPNSGVLGLTWTQADFNDLAWTISGPTGLGYENSPGDAVNFTSQIKTNLPSGISTAYIRVKFNLPSLTGIGRLTLRMKYDDGFAAYVNGVLVADGNAPETLQWDSSAGAARSDSASLIFDDFDISSVIPHLRSGENVLAIHALNQPTGSDMLIVPELVAQAMSISQPEIIGYFLAPTPGYGNGASVAGFSAEPTFDVPHGYYNTPQLVGIATSTPGAKIVYTTNGSTPQVDANLNITNGTLYVGPLTIANTTTLRARAFKSNFEPSYVEASSYIFVNDVVSQSPNGQVPPGWAASGLNGQTLDYGIDPDIINLYGVQAVKDSLLSLSTVSITTDLANLFDANTGIYVNALNRGDSWERPATVELINPDGSQGFEVNTGLRIRGGYSRNDFNPKHAFRIYFRGDYGDPKLHFPLFGDEGVDEFDVIDLRTEQNYAWSSEGNTQNSFVREVFGRDLQGDLGSPYTRSRYYHLYINGVYWGVYMTQERAEEFFGESYLGGDKDDYDVVKNSPSYTFEVSSGNDTAWRKLFDYGQAVAASPANANVYWTMQGLNPDGTRNPALPVLLDVDNLIDYVLILFYTGGYDSGISRFLQDNQTNNWVGLYNRVSADQGFQFFIHDNEHSLGAEGNVHGTLNIDRTGPFNNGNQNNYSYSNPQYLHQDLMGHPEYKQRFIDHVQKYFFNGGAMMPASSIQRLMERVSQVDPAIMAEAARWGDAKVAVPRNKATWQAEINWLVNTYFPSRSNVVLGQLRNDGLYTTFAAPVFSQHGGQVSKGYQLTVSAAAGTIYYTVDGQTDPRVIGGGVNLSESVKAYGGPISINGPTTVKARLLTSSGQWSGLVEAKFDVPAPPGDYDNNGSIDTADYQVWRANFGATVAPGTNGDGTGDGVVDVADYVVWREHLDTIVGFAQQSNSNASAATATVESSALSNSAALESAQVEIGVPQFATQQALRVVREGLHRPVRPALGQPTAPSSDSARDLLFVADAWRRAAVCPVIADLPSRAGNRGLNAANELESRKLTRERLVDQVVDNFDVRVQSHFWGDSTM